MEIQYDKLRRFSLRGHMTLKKSLPCHGRFERGIIVTLIFPFCAARVPTPVPQYRRACPNIISAYPEKRSVHM